MPLFWKQLLGVPVSDEDLKAFDVMAWRTLHFRDPATGQQFNLEEYNQYFDTLTYTTVLSDGTEIELIPNGSSKMVPFEDRFNWARLMLNARLNESALQVNYFGLFFNCSCHQFTALLICFEIDGSLSFWILFSDSSLRRVASQLAAA